jgi:transposase InsO family protein
MTPRPIAGYIEKLRRENKWGPARIAAAVTEFGYPISPATVHRVLVRDGLNRLRDLDFPTGETMRQVNRYEHEQPGDLIHVDVKKLGRIPEGGGWRIHGRGSEAALASKRKGPSTGRVGYTYLHSAVDDYSRLAYTEALTNEKGLTAAGFWLRAADFFAQNGVGEIRACLTDNGSCYRSRDWRDALAITGTKHRRTRPYTPRTNGKVERFNGTLAREWAYVRPYASEQARTAALAEFIRYYNHDRPHAALRQRPPVSRVTNVPGQHN